MPIWKRLKSATAWRNQVSKAQCAKDVALAASFVRSLESDDAAVNEQLGKIAEQLERIADRLEVRSKAKAA